MEKEFIEYIEKEGWIVVCESPLELEDPDGFCIEGNTSQFI